MAYLTGVVDTAIATGFLDTQYQTNQKIAFGVTDDVQKCQASGVQEIDPSK
jgi:hypothetical protein